MKTDLKEINSYTRQLDVTVEWDSIENEYQAEFNKARLKYNIPGFRKISWPGSRKSSGTIFLIRVKIKKLKEQRFPFPSL